MKCNYICTSYLRIKGEGRDLKYTVHIECNAAQNFETIFYFNETAMTGNVIL